MIIKTTCTVENMECPNCAMILESLEDQLKGIKRAEASYRKAQLTLEYDPEQVTMEQIKNAILKLGYTLAE